MSRCLSCRDFPCRDVKHDRFTVPSIEIQPAHVRIALISEAAPDDPRDHYYERGDPLFQRTTVQAFRDAGADVSSTRDILKLGCYLTTAVKCGKTGYAIQTGTVENCSHILEKELARLTDLRAILLMGDVAIKCLNLIARRAGEARVVPAGSTYRIRGGKFMFRGARVYPSYLQAGPSFFIEKSKRRMIAEDIASALQLSAGGR